MARTGYLKQAYSLWRSWFEQSIFFLYFLEAPLHKAAWKVKAEISQDDSPQYRLSCTNCLLTRPRSIRSLLFTMLDSRV